MKIRRLNHVLIIAFVALMVSCGLYYNQNGGGKTPPGGGQTPGQTFTTNDFVYFMSNGWDADSDTDDFENTMGSCVVDLATGLISSNCTIPTFLNTPGIPATLSYGGTTWLYTPNTAGNSIIVSTIDPATNKIIKSVDSQASLANSPASIGIFTTSTGNAFAYISNNYYGTVIVCPVNLTDGTLGTTGAVKTTTTCQDSGITALLGFISPEGTAGYIDPNTHTNYLYLGDLLLGLVKCQINPTTGVATSCPTSLALPGGTGASQIALAPNVGSGRIYASAPNAGQVFDCPLNLLSSCTAITGFSNPGGAAFYPTGTNSGVLYVANSTGTVVYVCPLPLGPSTASCFSTGTIYNTTGVALAVNNSGPVIYVPSILDADHPLPGPVTPTNFAHKVYYIKMNSDGSLPTSAPIVDTGLPQTPSVTLKTTQTNPLYPTSFAAYNGNIYFTYSALLLASGVVSYSPITTINFPLSGSVGITTPGNPTTNPAPSIPPGQVAGQVITDTGTYMIANTGAAAVGTSCTNPNPLFTSCQNYNLFPSVLGVSDVPTGIAYYKGASINYVYYVSNQANGVAGSKITKCVASTLPSPANPSATPSCVNITSQTSSLLNNPQKMVIFKSNNQDYAYITNTGTMFDATIPYTSSAATSVITFCAVSSADGSLSNCQNLINGSSAFPTIAGLPSPTTPLYSPIGLLALTRTTQTPSAYSGYLLISNLVDGEGDGYVLSCPINNSDGSLAPCRNSAASPALATIARDILYYRTTSAN